MRFLILISTLFVSFASYAQEQAAEAVGEKTEAPAAVRKTGYVVNPSFTISSRKLDQNSAEVGKFRTVQLDTKVGYVFDFGLFAGAQGNFSLGSTSAGTGTDTDVTTYFAGPSVGFSCPWTGLFLSATYHVVGTSRLSGLGQYDKITGYQIDVGYPMSINDNVKLGPQISIKNLDYKNGSSGLADAKLKELTPYFGLWLYF